MVRNTKFGLSFLLLLGVYFLSAQMLNPVKWSSESKRLGDDTFELHYTANIDNGWHLYSVNMEGVGIPTGFTYEENKNVELVGDIKEVGELHNEYSELLEETQLFFKDHVTFVQKVKIKASTALKCEAIFQVCDDEKCLPPDYKTFSFDLEKKSAEAAVVSETKEDPKEEDSPDENVVKSDPENSTSENPSTLPDPQLTVKDSIGKDSVSNEQEIITSGDIDENNSDEDSGQKQKKKGLWGAFAAGLLGGFAALLMPCFYPMIPLTVSLFTKQSKTRKEGILKAFIYGASIIFIFVLFGFLITWIFGGNALNAISTNPWLNLVLFAIFIMFALSFFGAFEITLPSGIINKLDKQADKGGYIGIFFMALVLVLVSFSCTGPIIGLSLGAISNEEYLAPLIAMFGFSLALAIPFTLFAIFPSWLHSLPKSGGWMNVLKVSFGFVELAFAMKFLSNTDLVWQLHWIEREIFLAFWVAIFLILGLYLLNIFKTSHDSDTKGIGIPRILFGILSLAFVFYMLPGLWGAPLKLMSGLTPPKHYSESPTGFSGNNLVGSSAIPLPLNAEYGPNGIPIFLDLDEAFEYAQSVNKPVMIDFTGDACANCRKMEETVWVDKKVNEILRNDVVIASLFADRRVDLPEEKQVYSEEKGRTLRTVGDKWSAFQIKHFGSNSQPLYVIVDKNMNRYSEPIGAQFNADLYYKWLKKGLINFRKEKPISSGK